MPDEVTAMSSPEPTGMSFSIAVIRPCEAVTASMPTTVVGYCDEGVDEEVVVVGSSIGGVVVVVAESGTVVTGVVTGRVVEVAAGTVVEVVVVLLVEVVVVASTMR